LHAKAPLPAQHMTAEDAATELVVPAEDEYIQELLTLHFLEPT